jgi:predicted ATPase/DNA-binding winged helix-turn-helix (wHTH) protein
MTGAYQVGPFRLDLESRLLTRDGQRVALGPRAIAVLATLVSNAHRHVPKSAIMDAAWPGRVVEDANLAVQISAIRRALAWAPGGDQWVETLARRGYRYVGPLEPVRGGERAHHLPRALTPFIGRNAARERLCALVREARLITITGPGGIGKTRLVVQVAEDLARSYRGGAWFTDLAPISAPTLVANAIGRAAGTFDLSARAPLESLCKQLSGRRMLLVLDNCEHVLDAASAAAAALVRNCPGITVIAASRELFGIVGEQAFALEPLGLPAIDAGLQAVEASEAGSLLIDCLRRSRPGLVVDATDANDLAGICAQLDGIPLALEFAAVLSRSLSLGQLRARLADRLALLALGSRAAQPRQRTLRAILDWSHEQLGAKEARLLRRCSLFRAGFTLEAARLIDGEGASSEEISDLLGGLVARSLVSFAPQGSTGRYVMLETTRAYAMERLDAAGETDEQRQRHAQVCMEVMSKANDEWLTRSDESWRSACAPELDDVRAALDWSRGTAAGRDLGVALAAASGPLWLTLSLTAEGVDWLRWAVEQDSSGVPLRDRARLWLWFGVLSEGDPSRAHAANERSAALYRSANDSRGLSLALIRCGRTGAMIGRHEAAESALSEAYELLLADHVPRAMGFYWGNMGHLRKCQGELADSRACYEKAIAAHRAAGAHGAVAAAINKLADLAWSSGDLDRAFDAFRENVEFLRRDQGGRRSSLGIALANLAGIHVERGDPEAAHAAFCEALPLLAESGFAWVAMDHCALRLALAGDVANAARLNGYADAAFERRAVHRQANELHALERLRAVLDHALPAEKLRRLREHGSRLSESAACRLATE